MGHPKIASDKINLLCSLSCLCCFCFNLFSQELVTQIYSGEDVLGSRPHGYIEYNDILIFRGDTELEGSELWRTDGTTAGTFMIKDLRPGTNSSSPWIAGAVIKDGALFFTATDENHGEQLWKTDGTAAGTVRVTKCLTGDLYDLYLVNNEIFFLERTGSYRSNLWKSDGTEAGTVLVKEQIAHWNDPTSMLVYNGLFMFTFQPEGSNNSRVWRSNGTESGTFPVTEEID